MNKPTAKEKKEIVQYYKSHLKRINFNGHLYLDIIKKNIEEYLDSKQQYEEADNEGSLEFMPKKDNFKSQMEHKELTVITFAAMFLECLIWDYAAVNTSQTFAENSLGKLNLLAKWKVIPKLINDDKKIEINSNVIFFLDKLVKERNEIVHSKSKPFPDTYKKLMKYIDTPSQGRNITARESYQCVIDCTEGLKKVDTTNYWFFQDKYASWKDFKSIRDNPNP